MKNELDKSGVEQAIETFGQLGDFEGALRFKWLNTTKEQGGYSILYFLQLYNERGFGVKEKAQ